MQAGLPAAIQAVRQTGERGQNCAASDNQLPGPQKKQRQEIQTNFRIILLFLSNIKLLENLKGKGCFESFSKIFVLSEK